MAKEGIYRLYSLDYDDKGHTQRKLAARFAIHGGQVIHMEDHTHDLPTFLPEGPADERIEGQLRRMRRSSYYHLINESDIDAGDYPDEVTEVEHGVDGPEAVYQVAAPNNPQPLKVEVTGQVVTVNGKRISDEEAQALLQAAANGEIQMEPAQVPNGEMKKSEPLKKRVLDPEEGYELKQWTGEVPYLPGKYHTVIEAFDKSGKLVGQAEFMHKPESKTLEAALVTVNRNHRRKGVASAMYSTAEKVTGMKVKPSQFRTKDAKALWQGNMRQQQFGKSEPEYDIFYHASQNPITELSDDKTFYLADTPENARGYLQGGDGIVYQVGIPRTAEIGGEKEILERRPKGSPYSYPWELLENHPEVWRALEGSGFGGVTFSDMGIDNEYEHKTVAVRRPRTLGLKILGETVEQFEKSENLTKMAISDNKPGVVIDEEFPEDLDYSHLIPEEMRKKGYGASGDGTERYARSYITHNGGVIGTATGYLLDGTLGIEDTYLDPKHRGLGLGSAMYEALMTHAFHRFGANRVRGSNHSPDAAAVHRRLSAKHNMGYYPDSPEDEDGEGPYEYEMS